MRARNVVILIVVLFVLPAAGGLVWLVLGDDGGAPPTEPGRPGATPLVAATDGDAPRPAPPTARERQPRAADAPADGAPWVAAAGFEEPLAAIDWAEAGKVAGELVPLLADAALASVRADEISGKQALRAAELRGALAQIAGGERGVFPSVRLDGAITHPAFAANLAAATLHARGGGLSAEQLEALEGVTRSALEAEVAASSEIDTTSFVAMRLADEFDRRNAFFVNVDELLTEKQRTLLHAAAARDRVRLDPLSAAAIWDEISNTLLFTDNESLFHGVAGRLLSPMGFDPPREEAAFATLRSRIDDLDDEMLPPARTYSNVMGFVPGSLAARWARWNSEVLRDIMLEAMQGRVPRLPGDLLTDVTVLVREPE